MAQEQVLEEKVLPVAEESWQRGEEEAEQFKHPGRVADPTGSSFALLQVDRAHVGMHAVPAQLAAAAASVEEPRAESVQGPVVELGDLSDSLLLAVGHEDAFQAPGICVLDSRGSQAASPAGCEVVLD
jgi:hypothetical protein